MSPAARTPTLLREPVMHRLTPAILLATLVSGLPSPPAAASSPDKPVIGFTEPVRKIDLAALESGTLAKLSVRKGDAVKADQTVGRLDDEVLAAGLKLARTRAEATATMTAAVIRLKRAEQRRHRLETLYREGHGGSEEIDEADAEVALAEAEVQQVEETKAVEKVEIVRIEAQLRRRRITAPFNGVVSDLLKREGEFVAPGDSAVLTLVDLSKLRVPFFVPTDASEDMRAGDTFAVHFPHIDQTVEARVEFVSPVLYADSNTVHVDMLIDNATLGMKAGRKCVLVRSRRPGRTADGQPRTGARR